MMRLRPVSTSELGVIVVGALLGGAVAGWLVPTLSPTWLGGATALGLVVGAGVLSWPDGAASSVDPTGEIPRPVVSPSVAQPSLERERVDTRHPIDADSETRVVEASVVPRQRTRIDAIAQPEAPPTLSERSGWRLATFQKVGNDPHQNEDAVAVSSDGMFVAIADGTSSAFASREWAKILVETFVLDRPDLTSERQRADYLGRCAEEWQRATSAAADDWLYDQARLRGSFAAFASVVMLGRETWRAHCVGDCCVIVVGVDGHVRRSFPLSTAAEFNSTPDLVGVSDPGRAEWQFFEGSLESGENLLLASDGLAEWVLAAPGRAATLMALDGADWEPTLGALRESDEMVNDDVVAATLRGDRTRTTWL